VDQPLAQLVAELARLPGIGPRTATRLAYHLLKVPAEQARRLAEAVVAVKEKLSYCSLCNSITAVDPCAFCTDPSRDAARLCVVEEPYNISPIERTREFHGRYHVLLGALSPQRGVGPGELRVEGLFARLDGIQEVILATNPNVEGEATALYLARRLKGLVPRITRLAFGMPVGGDIEYTDEVTLGRSLAGRRDL
jgi:recombination protein RecR